MKALTQKQKGVCDLLVKGFTNKEIGERLGISHRTVEWHREQIYERLGARNVVELVRIFLAGEQAHG